MNIILSQDAKLVSYSITMRHCWQC